MYSDTAKTKSKLAFMTKKLFHRRTKRLLTDSEILFQKYLDVSSLFSLLFLIMGIGMILCQSVSMKLYGMIFGLFLLGFAGIQFYFFLKRREFEVFRFSCISFFFAVVLGILYFILNPIYYILLWGFVIIVSMFEKLFHAFYLYRLHDNSFLIYFVSLFMMLILAILAFIHPFANLPILEVLGLLSILFHILNLSTLSLLQKRISEFVGCFD